VLRAIFDGYNETEKMAQSDPEDYPIWGYGAWNEFRDPLAAFIGCKRDEIALVRNATEANSYISNGVDLKAGDEVVIRIRSIRAASIRGTCVPSATEL